VEGLLGFVEETRRKVLPDQGQKGPEAVSDRLTVEAGSCGQ
jgi:hypothetical protein